ncbi:sulfotransferase domain-containing protein [uncultured Desulfobacter sp.]|uniref:sulfotransferase domain-containing protein n=1 Tax=uncultured Desulfobacter sp. TaxID=240139 RepID=UPI0029F59246|nr:sulfotransferase domain-containing protein [uncultured Desulfobacter sp.]
MQQNFKPRLKQLILKTYFRYSGLLFGNMDYSRFVVVGHARTGSNYLLNALNQIDSIRIYDEVFAGHNRSIGEGFEKIWRSIFCKQLPNISAVGFKLFYSHLSPDEWKEIYTKHDLIWVHLLRRNKLRTLVSLDIAFTTKRWAEKNNTRTFKPQTIHIESTTILQRIKKLELMEKSARESLSKHPYIELFYEEMVLDPKNEIGKIIKFIGVDGAINNERINMRKQNRSLLKETIENYNEIAEVLTGTKYEDYLID